MNTDIYLDPVTHDILIENGTPRLTSDDLEDAAQRLKIRIWIFQGEWILDTREGVPYYQQILDKTSRAAVDAILRAKILEEPLVERINQFSSTFDKANRSYELDFEVILTTGETLTQTFEIGV
jgi:hypothetical protein